MQHVSCFDKCLNRLERLLFQAYYRPVVLATVTWQKLIGLYRLVFRNVETLSRLSGALLLFVTINNHKKLTIIGEEKQRNQ
jgi:hypothetical protein